MGVRLHAETVISSCEARVALCRRLSKQLRGDAAVFSSPLKESSVL